MAQKNTKSAVAEAKAKETNMEETLNRWEQFFEKYKTVVIAAVVAVIVIVAGVTLYKTKVVEPKNVKVAEYMFPGEEYFINQQFEKALNGDEAGFAGFKEIADNYGGTKSGKLAAAYAGICMGQLGNYEEAITYLSKFKAKDLMVAPAVLYTMAECYANLDKASQAAATYEKAAKLADNDLQTPAYLLQAVLMYESIGENAKALNICNQIKSNYPASQEAAQIESYILRLSK